MVVYRGTKVFFVGFPGDSYRERLLAMGAGHVYMNGNDGSDDEDIDASNECFTDDSYCEGLPAISLKVNHKDSL